jgi:hypothetical protein
VLVHALNEDAFHKTFAATFVFSLKKRVVSDDL